ncbi:MAG: Cobalamin synthase [Pseudomonadota bacterium]|jgi:adenosylcobinamide-GDP ribazoletransferase
MFRALASAVLFLTRFPLPRLTLSAEDFARSAGWFSWVGTLVVLPVWAASQLQGALGVRLAALIAVASWVLITGGLHLDGLADTVDGLSGGRGERARTLEIMRDSRIGAHGALALSLVLMLKWAALEQALSLGARQWWVSPLAARFAATLCIALFPYARSEGLGGPFVGMVKTQAVVLGALPVALTALWLGPAAWAAAGAAVAVALWLGLSTKKRLGGLTGDTYGAAIELGELAALLGVSALR